MAVSLDPAPTQFLAVALATDGDDDRMDIEWNRDADDIMARMVARSADALASVVRDYSGQSVDVVRTALLTRWRAANEGADITDPELSDVAKLISDGKRVWLEPDGRIIADD